MSTQLSLRGKGVVSRGTEVVLLALSPSPYSDVLTVSSSSDGFTFSRRLGTAEFTDEKGKKLFPSSFEDLRISELGGAYYLLYKSSSPHGTFLYGAKSSDLIHFKQWGKIGSVSHAGMLVPHYTYKGKRVLYFGEDSIRIGFSKYLKRWTLNKEPVLEPRKDSFDHFPLTVLSVLLTRKGILLLYGARVKKAEGDSYSVGAALFDSEDPSKLLWRSEKPLWEQSHKWVHKTITPLGTVEFSENLVSYWDVKGEGIFALFYHPTKPTGFKPKAPTLLKKFRHNPILGPIADHYWESFATFNPAALYEEGKVHLLYRAIGGNGVSVLGYAASHDGIGIDERLPYPAYVPKTPFDKPGPHPTPHYMSGGGYGGCEDPRLTKIGDTVYMTYVACDGMGPPRVALTSIRLGDFLKRKWNWKLPVIISPPGVVDKNAVIFPEKINGKFVIFHRIFPNILVDFVDSLDFDGAHFLKGEYSICPRKTFWDSRKIGAGAPPIKTKDGWLLIYHAVGDKDSSRYKMGAMLLDLSDPTKILCRSRLPILEPSERYENEGYKFGVAYPGGAIVKDNQLFVYYGGADMVTCVATASLPAFLHGLEYFESARLAPVFTPTSLHYNA